MPRRTPKRTPKRKRSGFQPADDAPVDPSVHVVQAGKHMSLAEMHGAAPNGPIGSGDSPTVSVTPTLGHALTSDGTPAEAPAHQGEPVLLGWSARARAVKRVRVEGNAGAHDTTDAPPVDVRPVPVPSA